jgi:excinuclease ABC subunit B
MLDKDQLQILIQNTEAKMKQAAKDLDFISAAQYRDELFALKKKLKI